MIARVYGQLGRISPSPVVELNRAVAVGMAQDPEAGLALLDALAADGALAGYHLLPAARADLLRRLGRHAEAADAYDAALALCGTDAERRYLTRRRAEASAFTRDRPLRSTGAERRYPTRRRAEASAFTRDRPLRSTGAERRYPTRRRAEASAFTRDRPLRSTGRYVSAGGYGRTFQAETTGCSCS